MTLPLGDYEGHMSLPGIEQLPALSDLFAEALAVCCPASVAVLGVAGGNGLDRIDRAVTRRVVGIDCNPGYLDILRTRYALLQGLELHCFDLARETISLPPLDLVHAALIFEHAGTGKCLDNALRLLNPAGRLSVVLQLPSTEQAAVSPSSFPAMQTLQDDFSLIDPQELKRKLDTRGLDLVREMHRSLPAGKAFWMGIFTSASAAGR